MLVFGGSEGKTALGDLHSLNTETWMWSQPLTNGSAPEARSGHSGTMVDRLLFVIGGIGDVSRGSNGAYELGDVHVLDTDNWSWWQPEARPCIRRVGRL